MNSELNAAKEKLEIVKSRGEAAPNFLGKNAFELIQEYCTKLFIRQPADFIF